jgi:hypothetical protein
MADMRRGLRTKGQEDGLRTSLMGAIFTLIVAKLDSNPCRRADWNKGERAQF